MSFEEKYEVSKRKQKVGTYTAKEIIKLLRMRELSTIHKVKVDDEVMTVAKFIEAYECEDLPVQKLARQKAEEVAKRKASAKSTQRRSTSKKPSQASSKPSSGPPPEPRRPYYGATASPSSTASRPTATAKGKDSAPSPTRNLKAKEKPNREKTKPERAPKVRSSGQAKEYESNDEEPKPVMSKPLWSVLMISLFLILAYLGSSWLNSYRLKNQIEKLFDRLGDRGSVEINVMEINLDGFYLIDDPRYAKVQVKRDGKPHTYDFKISGNGITTNVKLEPIKKAQPIDEDESMISH
ncbi:MAG: hypothetical protein VB980_00685 [Opitutales bacterium]